MYSKEINTKVPKKFAAISSNRYPAEHDFRCTFALFAIHLVID